MKKFARYIAADNQVKWLFANEKGSFFEIEGDPFTHYDITDREINPSEIKITAPSEPTKIVAAGLNYSDHARELNMKIPEEPVLFIKPATSVIGPEEKIIIPAGAGRVDYEGELAVVIRNDCRNLDEGLVDMNIMGYTCFNDVTARDLQNKDGQWTRAKSFDTFSPCVPFIARGEDIDPDSLKIRTTVNGKTKQDSTTANFIFKTRFLVSFISKIMTLKRGDIVITGTPPGIGPLTSGDRVEVEIEKIGTLVNFAAE